MTYTNDTVMSGLASRNLALSNAWNKLPKQITSSFNSLDSNLGIDVMSKFQISVVCDEMKLTDWLKLKWHVTCNIKSECFISA